MPAKILRVRISGHPDVVREYLRTHKVDLSCGRPDHLPDGSVLLDAYLTEDQIERLGHFKLHSEVVEDATAKGKERQLEVSREQRFSKRQPPRGLGKKI
jgi:hypothetical protein